jgi:hypothetical protein
MICQTGEHKGINPKDSKMIFVRVSLYNWSPDKNGILSGWCWSEMLVA